MATSRSISVLTACLMGASLLVGAPAGAGGETRKEAARDGVRYLYSRQHGDGSFSGFSPIGSSADAALAMAMARRGRERIERALDFLEDQAAAATLGQKAKIVLAAVAGGRDPRTFGGRDLIADIEAAREPNGQYAEAGDFSAVTTHALAMLALAAVDVGTELDPPVDWLLDAQCPDGGWQFDRPHQPSEDEHCVDRATDMDGQPIDFASSDTNTTSYAVQALATHSHPVETAADPFGYFELARDKAKGGYRYSHEKRQFGEPAFTDANSTALVIQAYRVTPSVPYTFRLDALKDLRYARCGDLQGAFAFTWRKTANGFRRVPSRKEARAEAENDGATVVGATIGAIPGLMLAPLPVAFTHPSTGAPARRACK